MKPRVFVVQAIPEPAMKILEEVSEVEVYPHLDRQISLAETIEAAQRTDYFVALHGNFFTAEVLDSAPHLKGIGIMGGLTVTVDMHAALRHKIPVVSSLYGGSNVPPGPRPRIDVGIATAELTLAMMLSLAYRLPEADRYTRVNESFQEQTMALMSHGFSGLTMGLIGLGRVGGHLLNRLRGFDVDLLYTKRTRLSPEEEAEKGLEWTNLDDLMARSDFVVLLADYNPSTHEMIGAPQLALMKPTAYFVNPARGRIIDEPALVKVLRERKIAGAGLEVFYHEPPLVWHPKVPDELKTLDNVILAPHNGGAVYPSRANQLRPIAEGIKALIEGTPPFCLLNPEIYGGEVLYPELYERGAIGPAIGGG